MSDSILDQVIQHPEVIYTLAQELVAEREQLEGIRKQLDAAQPKADYFDTFVNCNGVSLRRRDSHTPTLSPRRLHRRRSCLPPVTTGSNQTPGSQTLPSSASTVRYDCPHRGNLWVYSGQITGGQAHFDLLWVKLLVDNRSK